MAVTREQGQGREDLNRRSIESEIRERNARSAQLEAAPESPTDKKVDEYTNDRGQRVLTFQRGDGSVYDRVGGKTWQKQTGHASPFEAFAYGTPEEKKAAQDFLDLEKRLGTRYRNPTEFEERYRLFQENPDAYGVMFGDKSKGGPDKATATKMLNYFDKRRGEVQQDFTLDDQQKKEQLDEIGHLEQPFMDAVQTGAGGGGGRADSGRVEVISPDGQRGTVPRSQLESAKRKGYRGAR